MAEKRREIDGCTLKIIAAFAMLCSHIYKCLLVSYEQFLFLDMIGRISFPIFCFLLAEGFAYTKDRKAYLVRLWVCAVFSEIPYNLAFFGDLCAKQGQNVLFTMFTGVLVLWGMEKADGRWRVFPLAIGMAVAHFFKMDYGFYGIWLIAIFGVLRGMRQEIMYLQAGSQICSVLLYGWIQVFSIGSLPFIWFYNGKRGKNRKCFFYVFYPLHLLILVSIRILWV